MTEAPTIDRALAFHQLRIAEIRPITDEAVELCFEVPDHLSAAYEHQPGQHLTLKFAVDGQELRRTYSITSVVGARTLCVGVKRVPAGSGSSFLTEHARVGDMLDVMTPAGRFTTPLDPSRGRQWLLIAAGSGITPLLSIARSVLAIEPASRVILLYGNRDATSIMFHRELDDLKSEHMSRLSIHHFFSRGRRNFDRFDGRIDAERLRSLSPAIFDAGRIDEAFVCGPEQMSLELLDALHEMGIATGHVHVELFGTADPGLQPAPAETDAAAVSSMTIRLHGVEQRVEARAGERVLDAAIRAGMDVPYACAGGVCATCRAHLDTGTVEMARNLALTEEEVAAGFVLTCQSTPTSPEISVDYDRA